MYKRQVLHEEEHARDRRFEHLAHRTNADMISVSATSAGLLRRIKFAGAHVRRGEQLAFIINPCDGSVREVLKAPVTGMLFFMQDGPFITEHSPVFQVLAGA